MLPVNLTALAPEHIQSLIDSEGPEGLSLEYKSELPTDQSESKREFIYDVAAMANAVGGDILFGVNEVPGENDQHTGIAGSISGLRAAGEHPSRLTHWCDRAPLRDERGELRI